MSGVIGTMLALIAVAASPCCFPALAIIGSVIGLGFLAPYEAYVGYALQIIGVLTALTALFEFGRNRQAAPLVFSTVAASLFLFAYQVRFSATVVYAGLSAMAISAGWNFIVARRGSVSGRASPQVQSVITCPSCGHQTEEEMPTNACLFFYDCRGCNSRLKPKPGDCCVFCSYGSVPCPPMQADERCCA